MNIMKKGFLLVSVLVSASIATAQLTQDNEPAVGSTSMYVVDTSEFMPSMAGLLAVSGATAVWDYSAVVMSAGSTQNVVVTNSSNSLYPSATKTLTQGTIVQYFHSTATERILDGYTYDAGAPIGTVDVVYDIDPAIMMTYPFAFGSSLQDDFEGTASTGMGDFGFTGRVYSSIDGTGTLMLPGEEVSDVFRLKMIDTVLATNVPFVGEIELIRTQFEYYKLATSNMPIFIDASIEISGMGAERQILSSILSTVNVDNATIENLEVYPNPSNGTFTINGNFSKGNVEVTDMAGRIVFTGEINAGSTVKLKDAKSGIYMVKVSAEGKTAMQKLTVK